MPAHFRPGNSFPTLYKNNFLLQNITPNNSGLIVWTWKWSMVWSVVSPRIGGGFQAAWNLLTSSSSSPSSSRDDDDDDHHHDASVSKDDSSRVWLHVLVISPSNGQVIRTFFKENQQCKQSSGGVAVTVGDAMIGLPRLDIFVRYKVVVERLPGRGASAEILEWARQETDGQQWKTERWWVDSGNRFFVLSCIRANQQDRLTRAVGLATMKEVQDDKSTCRWWTSPFLSL